MSVIKPRSDGERKAFWEGVRAGIDLLSFSHGGKRWVYSAEHSERILADEMKKRVDEMQALSEKVCFDNDNNKGE